MMQCGTDRTDGNSARGPGSGARRGFRRIALLPLVLLAACASGVPSGDVPDTSSPRKAGHFRPSGMYGAYLAGRLAASEMDTRVAAEQFARALEADPNNPELLQRAFLAALADGRDATALARRVLARDPQALIANLTIAVADANSGRFDRVDSRLRALPRQGAGQLLQPLLLAWAQLGRNQADQAIATLRPLTEGVRFRSTFAIHAGLIAELAGRPAEAERYFRLALSEGGGQSLRLAEIVSGFEARQGRPDEARRILQDLSAANDDVAMVEARLSADITRRAVRDVRDGMAEALLGLAGALRQQEAGEFALLLLRLSLSLRPDFAPASILLADVFENDRRYDAAAEALASVSFSSPYAPMAQMRAAILLDRQARTDAAVAGLDSLASANPARPEPLARMGDMLRSRSRFSEAARAYDRAIARLGAPDRRHWPLYYARGIAHERAKDWPAAERDFLTALDLAPDQPYVLNYLGYSWVEQGRELDRARRMIERAVELRPHDGHIVDSLGWVLYRLGDYRAAVRWLERAVELEPRDSVINDHLGDAYWAVGRHAEARFQWRRALHLGPEPGAIAKIEAKLRDGMAMPAAVIAGPTPATTATPGLPPAATR
ncbi:tetratricopeptide repeat protein [Elioraea rosea]|uniref:tetratricopeptide repeat protein n=1 Tax=Elioraea rosea TaxID=2492390 RepID=UPI001EF5E9ED|nr:tetratricopeptide repeat protein [Elioraea rosea]